MRYSTRLPWDLQPNPISLLLAAKRRKGVEVLDLTESNPTQAGLQYASDTLEALAATQSLRYDPDPAGISVARLAVSGYYSQRGHAVPVNRILLTASTSEAYAYLFKLLADAGDEILTPQPSYPMFEFLAALESVRAVPYPLLYQDGWELNFAELEHAITSRSRAIILVNPNNPTGSFLKRRELERLLQICTGRDLAIISDEVFSDYTFGPDERRMDTLVDVADVPTFCLSGLSKVVGLPQMKLGWMVASGPGRQVAFERLELIADTYLSVATPVQAGLARLLAEGTGVREQIRGRVRNNLVLLQSHVGANAACRVLEVEGGWYATLQVPRTRSEENWVLELLEHDDVLVQPGYFYDFESEAFLVLSLLTEPATFEAGLERLLRRVG